MFAEMQTFLKSKADQNGDGKVGADDLAFAIDHAKAAAHVVGLWCFGAGMATAFVLVHIAKWFGA